jgi:formylglycine-generating enzyme required for sulfatase activity
MDFVTIGNPGNVADTTGNPNPAGSVAYTYNIGKYEVSRDMIDKANSAGTLEIWMTDYNGNTANKPAAGITWLEAAKYVNWMNTSAGNAAAYKFDSGGNFQMWSLGEIGYNANNQFRNTLAKFFLPSTDEWYKAAYGSSIGKWYKYANGSDTTPIAVANGTSANTEVYGQSPVTGPADITNAGSLNAWGAMAMGGNVAEWTETPYEGRTEAAGQIREFRGGDWISTSYSSLERAYTMPSHESSALGFRVAMIPEPSSFSLLVLGGLVVALRRRR